MMNRFSVGTFVIREELDFALITVSTRSTINGFGLKSSFTFDRKFFFGGFAVTCVRICPFLSLVLPCRTERVGQPRALREELVLGVAVLLTMLFLGIFKIL